MTWGARTGRVWYFRHKGARFTDALRQWTVPIAGIAAGGKFLGLQSRWALVVALVIPIIVEGVAVVIGWWEHRSGATETEYRMALETDPFRSTSLHLYGEILKELSEIRGVLERSTGQDRAPDPVRADERMLALGRVEGFRG